MKKLAGACLLAPAALLGQAADPTTVVTSATSAFESVTTLVVAMVGFFIIVRIVKGIRK